ncbi:hypothetical protein N0B31_19280 [Salinirubellus salinus]|uniref:Rhamnogalacturonase A/B/Epimerase-like pectate lyase domain-containing protein n=1 Tax=Salinirubellus salinus TaxID=1364945 RepID=A0A9E7R1X4_9EURY|nr:glycosyl hydrolase family 28-related protein [Salinirubellus salinus]UWM54245.1 hypothetical protein N0B31_19280 [Salinirubellus salinus]
MGTPSGGTSDTGSGVGRRDVLTLLGAVGLGSLAGCNQLTGENPAVDTPNGGGPEIPDLSDVGSVYVGERASDLPTPERTPAVGITGEGNYVNDGRDWLGPIGMGTSEHPANPSHFEGATVHGQLAAQSLLLDGDVFDIRAYGAAVDGETDDLEAVQTALEKAAEVGGTVLVPKGTTVISNAIDLGPRHSGVTLRGVGYDSHVRLAGGHRDNHYGILVDSEGGDSIVNLTIEGLRLDGNRDNQVREHGLGIQIARGNGNEVDRGIVVRNVWSHDWMLEGLGVRRGGVMVRDVRVWNNRLHGIGVNHESEATNVISGVYAWNNGLYGIDVGGSGRNIVTDFVLVNNGWGFKTGGGKPDMTIFANGSAVGNKHFGFQMTDDVGVLVLDNIECRANGNSGFRFDKSGVVVAGTLVATDNGGRANVHVADGQLDVDTLVLQDAKSDGLVVEGVANVGRVVTSGNGGVDVRVPSWGRLHVDHLRDASRAIEGTLVEGRVASTALGGSSPDARQYETGTFVHDTDRDGRVWLVVDASKRDGVVKMS